MLKKILKITPFVLLLFIFCTVFATTSSSVQKDGIFTYIIEDGTATITNVDDVNKTVVVPDKLGGAPVTTLAGGAFGGSFTIEEVTLPDTITSIGSMCFSYCTELTKVNLPKNIKELENGIFNHCTKLQTIQIPDEVKLIDKDAFYRCDSLWTISIPDSVTFIGENAFAACPNLTAVTIPDSVTVIRDNAFEKANNLCIYAKPDSIAQLYAISHNIPYEELITVAVNGTDIDFDQPPVTDEENFRTLVPMRAIMTAINGKVTWDENTSSSGITLPGFRIIIRINEPYMKINGSILQLSSNAIEFNNRTLIPIRSIIEAIGGTVDWDEENKHIEITVKSNLFQ